MKVIELKKCFLFVLIICLFFMCSCVDEKIIDDKNDTIDEDKIAFVIDLIDELDGKVTLRRKDDVAYANKMYEELSDEEKGRVTNYDDLVYANNFITYLENEDLYIKEGIEECKVYLDNYIPSNSR